MKSIHKYFGLNEPQIDKLVNKVKLRFKRKDNLKKIALHPYLLIKDHLHFDQIYTNLSGVKGKSRNLRPVALKIAFPIAAETPVMPISPIPRAPIGEICGSFLPIK